MIKYLNNSVIFFPWPGKRTLPQIRPFRELYIGEKLICSLVFSRAFSTVEIGWTLETPETSQTAQPKDKSLHLISKARKSRPTIFSLFRVWQKSYFSNHIKINFYTEFLLLNLIPSRKLILYSNISSKIR